MERKLKWRISLGFVVSVLVLGVSLLLWIMIRMYGANAVVYGVANGVIGAICVFYLICCVMLLVFWIKMFVDVLKRQFPDRDEKLVWILIIVFAGVIGAIIYYFVIKREAVVVGPAQMGSDPPSSDPMGDPCLRWDGTRGPQK